MDNHGKSSKIIEKSIENRPSKVGFLSNFGLRRMVRQGLEGAVDQRHRSEDPRLLHSSWPPETSHFSWSLMASSWIYMMDLYLI